MVFESKAIVSRGPFSAKAWSIEPVSLRELGPDELLIEIVASGICHTDLHCGDSEEGVLGAYYPRVLGHEGSGFVVQVGNSVTSAVPGDPVLLSFTSCGTCHVCKTGPPSHCKNFFPLNFIGDRTLFSSNHKDGDIGGRFFGQSSFARHTIVDEKCVVNVKDQSLSREDLKLLAPLGCGLQTGSGTVVNVANAQPEDAVAVCGMGGVGLAAIMAAKIRNCKTIIGIDRLPARLELAKSLGATHIIDTSTLPLSELPDAIRTITDGIGVSIAIDTTGYAPLVQAEVEFTRFMGKIIQVGSSPGAALSLPMQAFMVTGKQYFGAIQGHSKKREYIPQLIAWWKEGVFPVEVFSKFFPVEEFEDAVEGMKSGEVVKPILVW